MKKTVSINISGMVFNIEEDAYQQLKGYLNAIKKYFANYADSSEIVADIENRVAEKFFKKLQAEAKQALNIADVNELIGSMGSVADFEAIAEDEDLAITTPPTTAANSGQGADPRLKNLFRDEKRKMLGGVLSGLAHYFTVDVVWLRLGFLVFFLGMFPASAEPISGLLFVAYIAFWVAFPGTSAIEDDEKVKKFYRDADQKVIGGVAAGLAAYFGTDRGLIRFLFVLSILLFGTGILLYLLLWWVAPNAQTLTQKMEMKGEPITLENIETNIKRNFNVENQPETAFTRLILLPFRAIGALFAAMKPVGASLGNILRVFFGGYFALVGFLGTTIMFWALVAFFGIFGSQYFMMGGVPLSLFINDVPPVMVVCVFFVAAIPLVAIGLAGVSMIMNRSYFTPVVWQSMLAIWLIGIIGGSIGVGRFATEFTQEGSIEKISNFQMPTPQLLLLDMKRSKMNYDNITLDLYGHDQAGIQLIQEFTSQGRNEIAAQKFAQMVTHNVSQKDSILFFDRNIAFKPDAIFRGQGLAMKLYIPYETTFAVSRRIAEDLLRNLPVEWDRIIWTNKNTTNSDEATSTWKISKAKGLECVSLKSETEYRAEHQNDGDSHNLAVGTGNFKQEFSEKDFQNLSIEGNCNIEIKYADSFRIVADANDKNIIEKLQVVREENTLKIKNKTDKSVGVTIIMPRLEKFLAEGNIKGTIKGMKDGKESFKINLSGNVDVRVSSFEADKVQAILQGNSTLNVVGIANTMQAELTGNSHINAFDLAIKAAEIDASDNAEVRIHATEKIKAITSDQNARVFYRPAQNLHIESNNREHLEESSENE